MSIENFKRFRELTLPMRALTVMTGVNGAGKTSVIQALLLARLASRGGAGAGARYVPLNGPFGLMLGDAAAVLHADAGEAEPIVVSVESEAVVAKWEFVGGERGRALSLAVKTRPAAPPAPFDKPEGSFVYLCAERWGPRDVQEMLSADPDDMTPGHQGAYVAHVLATFNADVRRELLHPKAYAGDLPNVSLRQNVEWWLSSIVCPVALSANTVPETNMAILRYGIPGRVASYVRPPNGGFGVTYALPIVLAALMVPRGGLLMVENPEAHLHPAGQSALGGLLARVAGNGVQVIVETHSDHVINGMRRAVGCERSLKPDDCVVHFLGGTSAPVVASITVNSRGELSSWPKGFFDQMDEDLAALMRVRAQGGKEG